jgi:hypothetical protein
MKIISVNYQRAYVTGPFLQEKLGMEIEIDTGIGETPEGAYSLAKQIMDQWHKINNPQLEGMTITDVPVIKTDPDVDGEQLDKEYEAAKAAVTAIEYREDAILWINNNGWTFNIDFKNIANSKPSKNA